MTHAFLDAAVSREPASCLTTSVYRKPTHCTDQELAYDSHNPQSVKCGIVKGKSPRPLEKSVTSKGPTTKLKSTAVLCYVNRLSEQLRRCLQQQGVHSAFKSETMLKPHRVWPKDAADTTKKDSVVDRIPCECGKVYIGKTGRPMQDRIKEHDQGIQLAHTQTSAVSGHAHNTRHYALWDEVKSIDCDPHWYICRVNQVIHLRLRPNNISRDSGIEIPEAWMPTIRKHNNRSAAKKWTAQGKAHQRWSKRTNHSCWTPTNHSGALCFARFCVTSPPHCLMKTSSRQSKHHDLHPKWLHHETNDNTLLSLYLDEQQ